MAEPISSNVHQLEPKRGRGRPKGSVAKAAQAAAKAEAIMRGAEALGDAPAPAKTQEEILDSQASVAASITAPGFGANEIDESGFLKWVQQEIKDLEAIAALNAKLKTLKGERKDHRNTARGEGVMLGDMDYAVKRAMMEDADVAQELARRSLYCSWLGLEVGTQGALPINDRSTPELEKKHWFNRGEKAGRLGKDRGSYPDGIPPERVTDFLTGWDSGMNKLLRTSPITAGAFNDDGSLKTENDAKVAAEPSDTKMLVLRPEDFVAGTTIKDASLATLFDDEKRRQFELAENVVALFDGKKKVLKEREGDGYFIDDGSENTPVSAIEDASDISEYA